MPRTTKTTRTLTTLAALGLLTIGAAPWMGGSGDTLAVAQKLHDQAAQAEQNGQLGEAATLYRRALRIRLELAPDSLPTAKTLNNLGVVLGRQGHLPEAEKLHRRALALVEKLEPESSRHARILNNLGTVSWFQGRLAETESFDRRALTIRQKLAPSNRDLASSFHDLGLLAWARGDLVEAENLLLRALDLRQKAGAKSSIANTLNSLGLVAAKRGQLELAAARFQRALEVRQAVDPDSSHVALSLENLAWSARARGELDLAESHYQRALALRTRLGGRDSGTAGVLFGLGELAFERNELDLAEQYHRRSLTLRQEVAPEGLEVALSLSALARIARARGGLEQALAYSERELRIRSRLAPDSGGAARTLHDLGAIHRQRGDLEKALTFYRQAVQALERQLGRLGASSSVRAGYRAQRRPYYRELIELLVEQNQTEEAFFYLEASRARTLLELLSERDLVLAPETTAELDRRRRSLAVRYDRIQQRIARLHPQDDSEELSSLLKQLRELRAEKEEVSRKLRRQFPRLASLRYPEPLSLTGAQEVLDTGTALLSYSVGEERTDLFVVTADGGLEVATLPVGEDELRRRVRDFRAVLARALPGDGTGARRSLDALAKDLYRVLVQPVEVTVGGAERLLVLPDGPLHLLPWGALVRATDDPDGLRRNDPGWQFLIEWKPVHLALSATVYAELKRDRRVPRDAERPSLQLAAFGDPAYPSPLGEGDANSTTDLRVRSAVERGVFDWQPLPHTRREVEAIAALYPGGTARTFLGTEATEEAAKSVGAEPRILHFATHGHLDDRFPLNSALVLSLPQELEEGQDNGLLQVWEVFERVRLDADLVVLSACASALGQELAGEGLIGLTRAFQYAGARSVLASLWNVRDRATSELMVRFYRHLRQGRSKDEALRAAQIELIRGSAGDEDRSAPYFWAAFQMYGDWK